MELFYSLIASVYCNDELGIDMYEPSARILTSSFARAPFLVVTE